MKRILLLLTLLLLTACSNYIELDNQKIKVEIADNPIERQQGLMYRESLCDDCGMLFIFDEETEHAFWMKNTLIPLDMVFIDSDFKVTQVHHAQPCVGECQLYIGRGKYVLETNVNMFDDIVGKKVVFDLD